MRLTILAVDDEAANHFLLRRALEGWREGEETRLLQALSPEEAQALAKQESFQIALVDLHYKDNPLDGYTVLEALKAADPSVELIVVSSAHDFSSVQKALRLGATDYVLKGFGRGELLHALDRALERRRWRKLEAQAQKSSIQTRESLSGSSAKTKDLKDRIRKFATHDAPVLVTGETGVGKELVARSLHAWGRDPTAAFVAVNCAAIPTGTADSFLFGHEKGAFTGADRAKEGVFAEADGGTLFLDEVNSLSLDLQAKLLRVLQEKEIRRVGGNRAIAIDFRVVAAANRNLEELVREGSFREDLYYRLGVLRLDVAPLRDRLEELEELALAFFPKRELESELWDALRLHSWPGNVREFRNLLWALDALAEGDEKLSLRHLPEQALRTITASYPAMEEESLEQFGQAQGEREREFLARAYRGTKGNVSRLARMMGVDRSHLHQKLVKLGIHKLDR